MLIRRPLVVLSALGVLAALPPSVSSAPAQEARAIVVASTTSTQDSGLFGHILPLFKVKTGITVRVVSQGTGQALDTGRRGDADVVLVHARPQEERFVADGFGLKRHPVMYNDFVLVGPRSDPAGAGGKDIAAGLRAIKAKATPFISRGDKSGTHAAELALWKAAGIDVAGADKGAKDQGSKDQHCIGRSARAWGRRSTPLRPRAPIRSPTAAPGCRSVIAASLRSWSKATTACSINTASCW
jgi:tungstate transport system substrate-binding protein